MKENEKVLLLNGIENRSKYEESGFGVGGADEKCVTVMFAFLQYTLR